MRRNVVATVYGSLIPAMTGGSSAVRSPISAAASSAAQKSPTSNRGRIAAAT
jgi:hypothetical protein